jgi:hypothetical protein
MSTTTAINSRLQTELRRRKRAEVTAVEAARWLDSGHVLEDRRDRLGGPLRVFLRDGLIDGAEQRPPRPHGRWFITRS